LIRGLTFFNITIKAKPQAAHSLRQEFFNASPQNYPEVFRENELSINAIQKTDVAGFLIYPVRPLPHPPSTPRP